MDATEKYVKMNVGERIYLLKRMEIERDLSLPAPNFKNTGMCLVGILRKGESVPAFDKRMASAKIRIQKDAERITFPNKHTKYGKKNI